MHRPSAGLETSKDAAWVARRYLGVVSGDTGARTAYEHRKSRRRRDPERRRDERLPPVGDLTTSPGSMFGCGVLDDAEIFAGRVADAVRGHASIRGGDGLPRSSPPTQAR
jgi:hypothetical protein